MQVMYSSLQVDGVCLDVVSVLVVLFGYCTYPLDSWDHDLMDFDSLRLGRRLTRYQTGSSGTSTDLFKFKETKSATNRAQ